MQSVQVVRLNTLRAAISFLDEYALIVPDIAGSGARHRLVAIVREIEALERVQAERTAVLRNATAQIQMLRRTLLVQHMAPIASIARMDKDRLPKTTALRMPRGNPETSNLLNAANRMMGAAGGEWSKLFVDAGLHTDFATRMNEVIVRTKEVMTEATVASWHRRYATKELAIKLAEARRIVDVLSTMLRGVADREGIPLTKWDVVKRVSAGTSSARRLKSGEQESAGPTLLTSGTSEGVESAA